MGFKGAFRHICRRGSDPGEAAAFRYCMGVFVFVDLWLRGGAMESLSLVGTLSGIFYCCILVGRSEPGIARRRKDSGREQRGEEQLGNRRRS